MPSIFRKREAPVLRTPRTAQVRSGQRPMQREPVWTETATDGRMWLQTAVKIGWEAGSSTRTPYGRLCAAAGPATFSRPFTVSSNEDQIQRKLHASLALRVVRHVEWL